MSLASQIDSQTQAHYIRVAEVIRKFGTPNKQYPRDKDIEFSGIREHYDVGGLGTVLKNMKAKVCSFNVFAKKHVVIMTL